MKLGSFVHDFPNRYMAYKKLVPLIRQYRLNIQRQKPDLIKSPYQRVTIEQELQHASSDPNFSSNDFRQSRSISSQLSSRKRTSAVPPPRTRVPACSAVCRGFEGTSRSAASLATTPRPSRRYSRLRPHRRSAPGDTEGSPSCSETSPATNRSQRIRTNPERGRSIGAAGTTKKVA
jgi:hypothetical protein